MKMIMMMLMTMTTIAMPFLYHPMSLGLSIMVFTASASILSGMMIKSFWFSYMLVIIMLGGMLVLFMYMSSIASNEKMSFSIKITIMLITIMTTMMLIKLNSDSIIIDTYPNNNPATNIKNDQVLTLMKLFSMQTMSVTILMVSYLLLTMIIISYIVNIFEGPMRKKH